MVSLGQKLKFRKTCKKRFFKHMRIVLCKKPLEKTPNIREIRRFGKSPIVQMPWQNGQFGSKIKFRKTCEKRFFNHIRGALCKKPLEKTPNIREMRRVGNRPSCEGYSLGKMVSLGQKLKFTKTCEKRFFNHIRVVLCKIPLEKTPNIREMRRFLKSAILQRPLQNGQFGSKIKIHKNMRKTIL